MNGRRIKGMLTRHSKCEHFRATVYPLGVIVFADVQGQEELRIFDQDFLDVGESTPFGQSARCSASAVKHKVVDLICV